MMLKMMIRILMDLYDLKMMIIILMNLYDFEDDDQNPYDLIPGQLLYMLFKI